MMEVIPSTSSDEAPPTHPHIVLPFKGFKGQKIVNNFKQALGLLLPKNVVPRIIYKGKKLGSFFPVKDSVSDNHKSNLVYGYHLPGMETNTYHYIGQCAVRHETRMYEHGYTDLNSAIFQHSREHNYRASPSDFTIIAQGYQTLLDRRLCEALFVRDHKPFLNKQKNSHKLELFD